MRLLTEFIVILGIFAIGLLLIVGGAMGVSYGINAWQCSNYEKVTGKPTKSASGMCYIQDAGQWYAWEEYRHRFVANGMLFQK